MFNVYAVKSFYITKCICAPDRQYIGYDKESKLLEERQACVPN